jgi:hypothetical protein
VAFAATLPVDQRAKFGVALAKPAQAQRQAQPVN